MYGDLVNNLKDRVIDGAIDSTLTSFKDNQILNKTFVWTAISKETYSGHIAYIVFINKNMTRRRIQYDQLANFILNNYVSNVVVNDGKVSMVGVTFNDLPDISGYTRSRYTEQDIYNKSAPYIQSTQQKIYEDFDMKCLKGHENDGEVHSNFSSNLSAVKDIAQAGAITAVTAAGTAAVTGITVGATKIYKAVNKKKLIEIQIDICKQLSKCSSMVEELIKTKQLTNNMLQNNRNIFTYNVGMDIQNDRDGNMKNLIHQYGIDGCITKIEGLIGQCVSRADGNKILDEPINKSTNNKLGTINSYSSTIKSRLEYLRQLHNTTKQIINQNVEDKRQQEEAEVQRRMLESQQNTIINDVSLDMSNIESNLNTYNPDRILDKDILSKFSEYKGLFIDMLIDTTEYSISQILDNTVRTQYTERMMQAKLLNNNNKAKFTSRINSINSQFKNDIINTINNTDNMIEELIAGLIGGDDYVSTVTTVNNNITNIRMNISKLSDIDRETLKIKLDSLENKLESNRRNLNDGREQAEKDANSVNEIKLQFSKYETTIANSTKSSDIKYEIDRFMSNVDYPLSKIKSKQLAIEWRHKINDKKLSFLEVLNNKKLEEEQSKNNKDTIRKELTIEIREATEALKAVDVKMFTREDLDNFISNEDNYNDRIEDAQINLWDAKTLKTALEKYEETYSKKYREANTYITNEEEGLAYVRREMLELRNNMEETGEYIYWTKDRLRKETNKLKTTRSYLNIINREQIDSEIDTLLADIEKLVDR